MTDFANWLQCFFLDAVHKILKLENKSQVVFVSTQLINDRENQSAFKKSVYVYIFYELLFCFHWFV